MAFHQRLANITGPVVRGLYYHPTNNLIKKNLHEVTVNSQRQLDPFFPIVKSLAKSQRHIITSPATYRHLRQTFLGTSHANF